MRRMERMSRLRDYKVEKGIPDPRGWKVVDGEGHHVGVVRDLVIETDRLDAAFSTLDTGAVLGSQQPPVIPDLDAPPAGSQAAFGGLGDALAGWDPDISGHPSPGSPRIEPPPIELSWTMPPAPETAPVFTLPAEAPSVPSAAAAAAPPVTERQAPAQTPSSMPSAPPTLVEAFAALLSAEQGRPFAPAAQAHIPVDERTLEVITQRVLDRMSDRVVRETVIDLAERLVREEIDRIKSNAR